MTFGLFGRLNQADPGEVAGGGAAATPAPSLEDTISANFDRIMSRGEEADEPAGVDDVDAAGDGTAAAKTAQPRNAAGRFAPKTDAAGKTAADPAITTDPAADPAKEGEASAEPPPQQPASKFADAPKSWNAQEKAAWDKVPEEARAAMHRREQDFFKGIEQYRDKAATFDALDAVIRPHADIFRASGQNALDNVAGLLNLQRTLATGDDASKVGTLLTIAQNVGIKPSVLIEALQNPQSQPAQDPRFDALLKRVETAESRLAEAQQAPVLNEVERFFGDPKNEFLSVPGVTDDMERLLKSGSAKGLADAYDKACRLSDSVRDTLKQRQAEADAKAAEAKQKEEAKRKADLAAKAARASSINVRQQGVTTGQPAKKGTLDETIGATFDAIMSRK